MKIANVQTERCTAEYRFPVVTEHRNHARVGESPQGGVPFCFRYRLEAESSSGYVALTSVVETTEGVSNVTLTCNFRKCLNHKDYTGPADRIV